MRNIGLTTKHSVTSIIYFFYNRVVMCAVEDRKPYHMITCILAMLPCCGCSFHVAMILAQPMSQHEAVSTICISVLIGFRYIRASESLIHRITCCTYGVLYGGNTILVCRFIRLEGSEDPHLRNSRFRRSRDLAHASIPLAQTPWGLTEMAWLQAVAQRVVIVVLPPLKSLGIDSRNESIKCISAVCIWLTTL